MADDSKVWLEYQGPSGKFVIGDVVLPLGVPVEVDEDVAKNVAIAYAEHRFIVLDEAPAPPPPPELPTPDAPPADGGPQAAPTSPEGGQDGGMPKA